MIISGTGSNCVLVNPLPESVNSIADINFTSSGGWGCHLGDEGSGNSDNFIFKTSQTFSNILNLKVFGYRKD